MIGLLVQRENSGSGLQNSENSVATKGFVGAWESMAPWLLILLVLFTVLAIPVMLLLVCCACDLLIRPTPPVLEVN